MGSEIVLEGPSMGLKISFLKTEFSRNTAPKIDRRSLAIHFISPLSF